MKVAGHIEPGARQLSHDVWQKVIGEMNELELRGGSTEFAWYVKRKEHVGAFEWREGEDELTVLGDLETVSEIAEQIATRLGGRFIASL